MTEFMPHGYCLFWEPGLVMLHVLSDIVTGVAYYAISVFMAYFLFKRKKDILFPYIFALFALFIFACGTTHLFAAYTIYKPLYWQEGMVKAATAGISMFTTLLLIPKLPEAISLPSLPKALSEVKSLNEKMAEQMAELKESRDKYSALIETTNTAFVILDQNGRVLDANAEYVRLTGYQRLEEIKGRSVLEWTAEYEKERNAEEVRKCFERGYVRNLEIDYADKNGKIIHVEINATVVNIKGAQQIFTICYDITGRKRAEEDLRQTNELFSLFIRHSPIYTYIKDVTPAGSRVLQASDNFSEMIGMSGAEIIGKTMPELFPPEFADKITADDWAVVSSGEVLKVDEDMGGRNYTTIKFPISQGTKTLLAGYTIDITDRKRAEEEHLSHLLFLESLGRVDQAIRQSGSLEGMFTDVLDAALSIFESDRVWLIYPCDPEAASWSVRMERTRPEYPGALAIGLDLPVVPDVRQAFMDVLSSSEPIVQYERSIQQVSRQFSVKSQILTAVYPKTGKPWVFGMHQCSYERVWSERDVQLFTEIARRITDGLSSLLFLKNLQDHRDHLEELVKTKEILLSEVHHRVKNNMAIIYSFLSLQERLITDNDVKQIFKDSRQRIKSMALVHEKLYRSKDLKYIDIKEYVTELSNDLLQAYKYDEGSIVMKINIDPVSMSLDILIPFGLIINEIVTNALKHAFSGVLNPEMSIDLRHEGDNSAILTVSDNGVGIPGDEELSQKKTLGFDIIKGLVSQIGGVLEIEKTAGTKYMITFPIGYL